MLKVTKQPQFPKTMKNQISRVYLTIKKYFSQKCLLSTRFCTALYFLIWWFDVFRFRYADRSYRHHPRGLIIYGPVTVSSIFGNNNATAATLFWSGRDNSNFSKLEAEFSTRNTYIVGSSQESLTANSTNSTVIPRCPLIPPNLGEFSSTLADRWLKLSLSRARNPSPLA